jgi:hypothetical protein
MTDFSTMSDDPYTGHWMGLREESGQSLDQDTEGHVRMHEFAREADEPEKTWEDDDVYQSVAAAKSEVDRRGDDKATWDRSRETRQWLAERWENSPHADLNHYVADKLNWLQLFQRDPHNAREAWTRHWARVSPFHFQEKAKAKAPEPPADLDRHGKREWEFDQDTRRAYAEAARNAADEKLFQDTARMRAILREKMPGASFDDFLEKCRIVDVESLQNPDNVAARFAQFFGAPVTELEARERQTAGQQQDMLQRHRAVADQYQAQGEASGQRTAAAETWLQELKANGLLTPDYDALESEIGDVLAHPQFIAHYRTGNWAEDLNTAIHLARQVKQMREGQQVAQTQTAQAERVRAETAKARHASRSVASSSGDGSGRSRRRDDYDGDDLYNDVRNAVRRSV